MKRLLQFVRRDLRIDYRQFLLLAGISALANAAVLAVINLAAENAAKETRSHRYLLLFMIAVAIYVFTQKRIMLTATTEMERLIHRIRVRLIEGVRAAELVELDQIGRAEIYASLSSETATLANSAVYLAVAFQSVILVAVLMIYVASLSLAALALNLLFTVAGAAVHLRRAKEINRRLHAAAREVNRLHEGLLDMLDGFKEVKLSSARGDELCSWIERASLTAADLESERQRLQATDFVLSQVTFFVLTATMVFLVPMFGGAYSKVVIKTTAATLFLIGPISNVVSAIPIVAKARAALENIAALEERLQAARRPEPQTRRELGEVAEIRFEAVTFRYDDGGDGFLVGPLDLSFRRGETVFISGGNGSGKTTLVRLLTGLYKPQTGRILVDGVPLDDSGIVSYRNLFAVIFSDNHLFKRLYGIPEVAEAEVEKLFQMLEMEGKTRLGGREFETIELSSGQRKRLALMVSVLEHKPISVFDEWAADQDPHFRRKFYTEVLDWLKARGATIIAVTHDENYYRHADRLLVMSEGRIVDGGGRSA